jgi:hypothetical protein
VKNKTYPGEQEPCQERDDDGSTLPKRLPVPYHKSGTDDWDKDKEQEGHKKIKMIPFAMEGEEGGIAKYTWHPVNFASSHVMQLPPATLKPGCSFDQPLLLQSHLSI